MESPKPIQPDVRFLTFRDVQEMTGMSRSTIYRQIKRGDFPKPRAISLRKVAFLQMELESWARQRREA